MLFPEENRFDASWPTSLPPIPLDPLWPADEPWLLEPPLCVRPLKTWLARPPKLLFELLLWPPVCLPPSNAFMAMDCAKKIY